MRALALSCTAAVLALACARPERGGVPPATPVDVATAMQDTVAGWFRYASDGTARSDTARRLAALALWDWEGGDRARGMRLLRTARHLGVADSLFYFQAGLAALSLRRPALAESLFAEAVRRWPRFGAAWRGYAHQLMAAGRVREAAAAQARAAALAQDP